MSWIGNPSARQTLAVAVDLTLDPDFSIREIHAIEEALDAEPAPLPTLAELGFDRATGTVRGRRLA